MDSYNISEAISQGEARTGATEQLNNQIRINNKAARDAVPGKVSGDELKGGIGGIKDVEEVNAGSGEGACDDAIKKWLALGPKNKRPKNDTRKGK